MENANSTAALRQHHQHQHQQQQQQQQQHQQHHHQQQQQQQHMDQHEHGHNSQQQHQQQQQSCQPDQCQQEHQQFCLRWHNHQTSLLSTLPELLDQSHLTDLTISVEGRVLRAHRVVLSACSTYFSELFRMLEPTSHPVIIIPGASFGATVSLLTFMYSGEVNVYEDQIPMLLSLAETLGVKGLADVPNKSPKFHTAGGSDSSPAAAEPQTRKRSLDLDRPGTPAPPISGSASPQAMGQHSQQHHLLQQHHQQQQQLHQSPHQPPAHEPHQTQHPNSQQSSGGSAAAAASQDPNLLPGPLSHMTALGPPPPPPPAAAASSPLLASSKLPTPLERLFLKSLQFYPNLLPPPAQPLNFSQSAFSKTTELLAKYQQQCHLYQGALSGLNAAEAAEEASNMYKRLCTGEKKPPSGGGYTSMGHHMQQQQQQQQQMPAHGQQQQQQQQKDIKRIDKIVESLRCGSGGAGNKTPTSELGKSPGGGGYNLMGGGAGEANKAQVPQGGAPPSPFAIKQEDQEQVVFKLQQQIEQFSRCGEGRGGGGGSSAGGGGLGIKMEPGEKLAAAGGAGPSSLTLSLAGSGSSGGQMGASCQTPTTPGTPTGCGGAQLGVAANSTPSSPSSGGSGGPTAAKTPSNSKLYATCFICHKQLSNQYNLRVHLETHQNVRYACNVCSHVSRSKDALRKHVSYRHPGAPSPCETEARRKRASKALNAAQAASAAAAAAASSSTTAISPPTTPSTPTSLAPFQLGGAPPCGGGGGGGGSSASAGGGGPGGGGGSGSSSAGSGSSLLDSETSQLAAAAAAAQLGSPFMFLPNQFQMAAAAAAVQHHHQQLQSLIDSNNNNNNSSNNNNSGGAADSGSLGFPLNLGSHASHLAAAAAAAAAATRPSPPTNPSSLLESMAKEQSEGTAGGAVERASSTPRSPLLKSPTPPAGSLGGQPPANGQVGGAGGEGPDGPSQSNNKNLDTTTATTQNPTHTNTSTT